MNFTNRVAKISRNFSNAAETFLVWLDWRQASLTLMKRTSFLCAYKTIIEHRVPCIREREPPEYAPIAFNHRSNFRGKEALCYSLKYTQRRNSLRFTFPSIVILKFELEHLGLILRLFVSTKFHPGTAFHPELLKVLKYIFICIREITTSETRTIMEICTYVTQRISPFSRPFSLFLSFFFFFNNFSIIRRTICMPTLTKIETSLANYFLRIFRSHFTQFFGSRIFPFTSLKINYIPGSVFCSRKSAPEGYKEGTRGPFPCLWEARPRDRE